MTLSDLWECDSTTCEVVTKSRGGKCMGVKAPLQMKRLCFTYLCLIVGEGGGFSKTNGAQD
jgi:hypothetical protein